MALLQAAIIGLIALLVTPGYLFYFDVTPKLAVLLAGTALTLLFTSVMRPAHRWLSLLLLLNAISLGVSTALSSQPDLSSFGTNWRRFGAVPQLTVLVFAWLVSQHTAGRPDRVRTILRGIAVSGAITALYGIAQYFGWDPLLPASAYHIGEGLWSIVRPPGTMGYVSYFATWLLAVSFSSMALHSMETNSVWRKVALAAAALASVATVFTGTRAALLGMAAGIAVWLYSRGFRITRRMVACAGIALVAAGAFYFSPPGWKLRSRIHWATEDRWGGGRRWLWRDSLHMSATRPLVGFGPEVFTGRFPQFESKTLAEAYPDFSYESPHNILLDALVSQGIPGLAILLGLCVLGLKRAREGGAASWIAAGVAAALVAQQFTVFILPTAVVFYVMIALATSGKAAVAASSWRLRLVTAPVALALIYVAVHFTAADRSLALTRRSIEAGDLAAATAHFEKYQQWRLPGASADLWYSRMLLNVAMKSPAPLVRFQAARQSAAAGQRATKTAEEHFDAWYSMAEVYAVQNDAAHMESSLRAAIAARPNWFKPHWALAQLLRLQSRLAEAEHEAELAAELNGGKHPEVARTLVEIRQAERK